MGSLRFDTESGVIGTVGGVAARPGRSEPPAPALRLRLAYQAPLQAQILEAPVSSALEVRWLPESSVP